MTSPVAFDTETFLIRPGLLAPPMVCLTSAMPCTGARLLHVKPEMMPHGPVWANDQSSGMDTARSHFEWLLEQDPIYGLNVAFDMAVCASEWPDLFWKIFKAYEESRVVDIGLSQQLIDISKGQMKFILSQGGYSLAALVKRHLGKDRSVEKKEPDAWRLRYKELYDVTLPKWPAVASKYALDDAQDTLDVATKQWLEHQDLMKDSPAQARASFALHLMMCWGIKTDPVKIKQLEKASKGMYEKLDGHLVREGLVRKDGTKNTRLTQKRMLDVRKAAGLPLKLTKTGYVKFKSLTAGKGVSDPEHVFTSEDLIKYMATDEEACNESGDDLLFEYSRRTQLYGIIKTHIPDLWKGVDTPIQPRYNTLVDSGRTSCAKSRLDNKKKKSPTNGFQFQNPKRSLSYFPSGVGIRECFVARPGMWLADPDFTGLELCTGAQACIETVGFSKLAEALNAGRDPHLQFGAKLMGISYKEAWDRRHEKEVKNHRQYAKPANFGIPGGLGIPGLIGFARGYGVILSPSEAKHLRDEWFQEFPEWKEYFNYIRGHIDRVQGKGEINQLYVDRIRGGVTFTSACNTLFQGLGGDGAKHALYEVAKRCYVKEEKSILYGARPVGFVHDEIPAEVFQNIAHEQATEMGKVMVDACNKFLPDVPVKCEPALCLHWSKDVEAVYDGDGRLQPWDVAKEKRQEVFYDDGGKVKWAA